MQPNEIGMPVIEPAPTDQTSDEPGDADPPLRRLSADAEQSDCLDQLSRPPSKSRTLRLKHPPGSKTARPAVPKDRSAQTKKRFIAALATSGNPTLACAAGGTTRAEIAALRLQDAVFDQAVQEALEEAADLLEAEARRRAVEGISEPVIQGGKLVIDPETDRPLMVRRYSDALLILLLKSGKPERFARTSKPAPHEQIAAVIKEIASDDDPPRGVPQTA